MGWMELALATIGISWCVDRLFRLVAWIDEREGERDGN